MEVESYKEDQPEVFELAAFPSSRFLSIVPTSVITMFGRNYAYENVLVRWSQSGLIMGIIPEEANREAWRELFHGWLS